MELKYLIDICEDTLQEEMNTGEYDAPNYSATVDTEEGYIDLFFVVATNELEVIVNSDAHPKRVFPNLEAYLQANINVSMEAAREYWRDNSLDEWQSHGFRDEADFWRWKEG